MGYHRAGFDVTGVDLQPQPRYPFPFIQGDALEVAARIGRDYDVIHASPPCQRFSTITAMHGPELVELHPDLVAATRELLLSLGIPYVIENVPGAPLRDPLTLCGSTFGLGAGGRYLRRHRGFESSALLLSPGPCDHRGQALGIYGHPGGSSRRDGLRFGSGDDWREAMGIDWMRLWELTEAIPPAYTEYVGARIL